MCRKNKQVTPSTQKGKPRARWLQKVEEDLNGINIMHRRREATKKKENRKVLKINL